MSKPAAGYTRLSQDGISIEKPTASIRDDCRNHDLDLTTIYDDGRHASGYSVGERPEYQALRERVRNRDVAAMTLRDMGRLGRDFDERMLFIIDLRKAGIELHTVERGQRDLGDLDRAILDYFTEGRGEVVPWGIATPAVVRAALLEREYPDVTVRQTINNRKQKLADADHLENQYDKGVYVFRSDPRNSD